MESMSCGKILVVDDHPAARQSVMDALKIFGHEVAGCESARPALQRLRRESFDVILTDLMMPGMNGLQFLGELTKMGSQSQTVMMRLMVPYLRPLKPCGMVLSTTSRSPLMLISLSR